MHHAAFGSSQQGRHVDHAVRGWTNRDGAVGLVAADAIHDGVVVESKGDAPGCGVDFPVSEAVQPFRVSAEFGVHRAAICRRQAGGMLGDDHRPGFGKYPGFQRGEGVGHVVDQDPGALQVPGSVPRRGLSGQADLGGQTSASLVSGDALGGLAGMAFGFQHCRHACLPGRDAGGGPVHRGELIDQRLLAGVEIDHGARFEHMFDNSAIH